MSNKRGIKSRTSKKRKPPGPIMQGGLTPKMENQISAILQSMISPIEKRLDTLFSRVQNVKSNLIVSMNLLEKKKLIQRQEFLDEYVEYEKTIGMVDGSGRMGGRPIFSLYNMEV